MSEPLLSVRNLKTVFNTENGRFAAVDDVSFDLAEGEVIGIVGESGSGKSVTALSIMGLVPSPPGRIAGGEIVFEGRNLLELSEREMRRLRGGRMGMIFQEPMTSLNPVFTVGDQLQEGILEHERVSRRAARDRAVELLDKVGIAAPAERLDQYPHQMSGGMRQRVMIAMALSCNPRLLLADEPTTALDVTIQAQILDLLRDLQEEFNMAVIMITHNLGVVAEFADKVMVMYCGRAVETAPVAGLFEQPSHPYTEGLLRSIPHLDHEGNRLRTIPGTVPNPMSLPPGCRFANRCEHARPACNEAEPAMVAVGPRHGSACIRLTGYRHGPAVAEPVT